MKVLITRRIHQEAVELLASRFDVDYIGKNEPLPREFLIDNIRKYQGILCCVSEKFDADLLMLARTNLKIISNMAAGLDNIDAKTARSLGIEVRNTAEVVTECTADFTLALALSLLRKVPQAQNYIRLNRWISWDPEIFLGRNLRDLTWGIIGLGKIGQAVAKRLHGFGCRILYCDPHVTLNFLQNGLVRLKKAPFEELLRTSDIISLHVPLTEETTYLINSDVFKTMKKTALLINMARGQVVNTSDLVTALKNDEIAGAALDVVDPEPLSGNHDILRFDNIIITPHIGTATEECRRDMAVTAAKNIVDFFDGEFKQ
jgi:lactate dehydrogenase-like 2-hydroxyacid dehydrogenase